MSIQEGRQIRDYGSTYNAQCRSRCNRVLYALDEDAGGPGRGRTRSLAALLTQNGWKKEQ